jgi:hypothetical protein
MGEMGNVRLKGAIRFDNDGDIVAPGSNNGMFELVNHAGVGLFEYTVDPEWSISPSDIIKVQVEGDVPLASSVNRISETRFDVYLATVGGQPASADASHAIRVTNVNRG